MRAMLVIATLCLILISSSQCTIISKDHSINDLHSSLSFESSHSPSQKQAGATLNLSHTDPAKRDIGSPFGSTSEEVQMVKRVYPNRIQHYHHHHYRRPMFTERDRAFIRGPPGAERGFLGRVGATATIGAADLVGTAIGLGICETAHIWIPALGRCVERAIHCVGDACYYVYDGATRVVNSVRGRQEAISNRINHALFPAVEAVPPPNQSSALVPIDPASNHQGPAATSDHQAALLDQEIELGYRRMLRDRKKHLRRKREADHRLGLTSTRRATRSMSGSIESINNQNFDQARPTIEPHTEEPIDSESLPLEPSSSTRRGQRKGRSSGIGKGKAIMEGPVFKKEASSLHLTRMFDLNLPRIPSNQNSPIQSPGRINHLGQGSRRIDLNRLASFGNSQEFTFDRGSGTSALDPIIISDSHDASPSIPLAIKSETPSHDVSPSSRHEYHRSQTVKSGNTRRIGHAPLRR